MTAKPKRRSHRNTCRLTAKERAGSLVIEAPLTPRQLFKLYRDVQKLIADHARDTLARYRRKRRVVTPLDMSRLVAEVKPAWDKAMAKGRAPLFSTRGLSKALKRTAKR